MGKVVGALLPCSCGSVRLSSGRAPSDGLHGDDDDDDEKEAGYAAEALERLCEALGGDAVTWTLLPELRAMLAPASAWNCARPVALAFICDTRVHRAPALARGARAGAPPRRSTPALGGVRASRCSIRFSSLVKRTMASTLLIRLAGGARRARRRRGLPRHRQRLRVDGGGGALAHAQPTSPPSPVSLAGAARLTSCVTRRRRRLAVLAAGLEDADGAPMASAAGAFIPHLAQLPQPAVDQRNGASRRTCSRRSATSRRRRARRASPPTPRGSRVGRRPARRPEVTDDRDLLAAYTCAPGGRRARAFLGVFEQLLALLAAAAASGLSMDKVSALEEEEDAGTAPTCRTTAAASSLAASAPRRWTASCSSRSARSTPFAIASRGASPASRAARRGRACLLMLMVRQGARLAATTRRRARVPRPREGRRVGRRRRPVASPTRSARSSKRSPTLNEEKSIGAADALLDRVLDVVGLERTAAGALPAQQAVGGVCGSSRSSSRRATRAPAPRAAANATRTRRRPRRAGVEAEEELLATCASLIGELLRQHGGAAGAVGVVEAQLLHIQPWLAGDEVTKLALGLEIVAQLIMTAEREHAKKYVSAALPLLGAHADSDEPRLRRAALCNLGVVAEHGGSSSTRRGGRPRQEARRRPQRARAPLRQRRRDRRRRRRARQGLPPPAAGARRGGRPAALAGLFAAACAEDAASAVESLCKMLEADAPAVFGADSRWSSRRRRRLRRSRRHADASGRLRALVHAWKAQHGAQFDATVASGVEKAHLREKIAKIAAA